LKAVVVANGVVKKGDWARNAVESSDLIVCADGGTVNALSLGLQPQVVIGDVDSVNPELRRTLEDEGTEFIIHSPRKDETDAELALCYCVEQGADLVLFLGALGGRLDHELANLLLLADSKLRSVRVRMVDDDISIELCSRRCEVFGNAGDIVSLLPWSGDVTGVRTSGLEYLLDGETLFFGPARGMSNVLVGDRAVIEVETGLLLVMHYGAGVES